MARLASFLDPGRSLDESYDRVRLLESLGYEGVICTQTVFRDPLQVLAAYAARTERIRLVTGVVPIATRHPVQLAMEAATLDEASGGRFTLGMGVSHALTVETMWGLTYDKPAARMEEYAQIVHDVLRTGTTMREGRFHTARYVSASGPRPDLPIWFAAMGPRMLKLAAKLGSGTVLWMCSPSVIRDSIRPVLERALEEEGRDPAEFDIVAAVPVALTENPDGARDRFRQFADTYLKLPNYRKEVANGGFQDVLDAFDANGIEAVPAEFCDVYIAAGDADAIRSKIEEYREAGVSMAAPTLIRDHEGSAGFEETMRAAIS
ncbi:MAG: LLM class flavin-dependent oxidoreductase [Actinomycetota bacterium]